MSDTLGIIRLLGDLTVDDIAVALENSAVSLGRIHDAYDAAEVLESDDAIDGRLRFVTREQYTALASSEDPTSPLDDVPQPMLSALRAAILVTDRDVPLTRVFEHVHLREPLPAVPLPAQRGSATPWSTAASIAFRTVRLVDGLIACLREAPAKALQRGGLAQPDRIRIAGYLGIDSATAVLRLAGTAGLIGIDGGRACGPTAAADSWQTLPPAQRWLALARGWDRSQNTTLREATITAWRAGIGELAPLSHAMQQQLPFAEHLIANVAGSLRADARALGVADDAGLTKLGIAWFDDKADLEAALAAEAYPEIDYVYPQADLTVIAPGILTHTIETKLHQVATCITFGDASIFRVSPDSLRSALRQGWSAEEILSFLTEVSRGELPQPLRYVIHDTAERLGSILVRSDDSGALISTATPDLAETILSDRNLIALGLRQHDATTIESRIPADVALNALIDAHYPAIRVDDSNPAASTASTRFTVPVTSRDSLRVRAEQIAASVSTALSDADTGSGSDQVTRMIEMSVRHHTPITVTVRLPNGDEATYALAPSGFAGGRLRAKDRAAEIERTLPVSHILHVEPIDET